MILKNGEYAIHEVFYDQEGEPWTCSENPLYPTGDTLDALRQEMKHYQRALEQPVLEYADLVPDHESPDPDVDLLF